MLCVPRYKLTIAYDGTDFCGWQKQEPPVRTEGEVQARPSRAEEAALGQVLREGEERPRMLLRTVQEVVERAVRSIVREPVVLMGASRTDAGVHAKGQVAAFTCAGEDVEAVIESEAAHTLKRAPTGWPPSRGMDRLVRALNGRLPEDVVVQSCEVVDAGFNPIGGATSKAYSYTIHASQARALWDRRFVHQVWEPLDVAAMQEAAAGLVGEHDFAGFAAAGHGRLSTVRTVYACTVTPQSEERLRIDVSGSGFLYNMVRIIAGTLVDVGKGRLRAADIPAIIESLDRRRAGPTLPAQGLCLEWIRYERPDVGVL